MGEFRPVPGSSCHGGNTWDVTVPTGDTSTPERTCAHAVKLRRHCGLCGRKVCITCSCPHKRAGEHAYGARYYKSLTTGRDRYNPACACGWVGPTQQTRRRALQLAREHAKEAAEKR